MPKIPQNSPPERTTPAIKTYYLLQDKFIGTAKWHMVISDAEVEFRRADGRSSFVVPNSLVKRSIGVNRPETSWISTQSRRNLRVRDPRGRLHHFRVTPDTETALRTWLHGFDDDSDPEVEVAAKKAYLAWGNLFAGFGATAVMNLCLLVFKGPWAFLALPFGLFALYSYFSAPVYTVLDFVWFRRTRDRRFLVHGIWGLVLNAIWWPIMISLNVHLYKSGRLPF